MNKNKMTFRFDHSPGRNNGTHRIVKEESKVIPLHVEEYHVKETPLIEDSFFQAKEEGKQSSTPPSTQVKQPLIDAQPLNLYTTDYGGWQSSFDAETNRVEQLIRESNHGPQNKAGDRLEPLRGSQERQEPYVEPVEPLKDHRWYVPEEPVYVSGPRKPNTSWIKVATSVAGAIVTGIAFGFFVLSMFSGDTQGKATPPTGQSSSVNATNPGVADKGTAAVNATSKTTADKTGTANPAVPASASAATGIAVSIPAKSYSFLQSGVFSTPQSADAAQADLKKKAFSLSMIQVINIRYTLVCQ